MHSEKISEIIVFFSRKACYVIWLKALKILDYLNENNFVAFMFINLISFNVVKET